MNDLKPVAFRYRTVGGSKILPASKDGRDPMVEGGTKLYAIPPTHRVVSVCELEAMHEHALAMSSELLCQHLRAIIDNAAP